MELVDFITNTVNGMFFSRISLPFPTAAPVGPGGPLLPGLIGGNTEQVASKPKICKRFPKPNFELGPNWVGRYAHFCEFNRSLRVLLRVQARVVEKPQ